jgi:hypothetical protein
MSPYPPLQPEAPPDIAEPNCPPPALALEEVPAPTSLPLDVATADSPVSPQPLSLCPPPLAASAETMKLLLLATNPIAITTANSIANVVFGLLIFVTQRYGHVVFMYFGQKYMRFPDQ